MAGPAGALLELAVVCLRFLSVAIDSTKNFISGALCLFVVIFGLLMLVFKCDGLAFD